MGHFHTEPSQSITFTTDLYKKNNDVHGHNTRTKDMFRISLGTFSNVSAKIWNALFLKFDLNVPYIY